MIWTLLILTHGLIVPVRPFATLEDCQDYRAALARDYAQRAEAQGYDLEPPDMQCAGVR